MTDTKTWPQPGDVALVDGAPMLRSPTGRWRDCYGCSHRDEDVRKNGWTVVPCDLVPRPTPLPTNLGAVIRLDGERGPVAVRYRERYWYVEGSALTPDDTVRPRLFRVEHDGWKASDEEIADE